GSTRRASIMPEAATGGHYVARWPQVAERRAVTPSTLRERFPLGSRARASRRRFDRRAPEPKAILRSSRSCGPPRHCLPAARCRGKSGMVEIERLITGINPKAGHPVDLVTSPDILLPIRPSQIDAAKGNQKTGPVLATFSREPCVD